jgi:uncharacterized phosphosugar-binding protein
MAMTAISEYTGNITNLIKKISYSQADSMRKAARMMANAVKNDGIVYTFGTGHSHIIAEDVAYRAGGLVPVDAILEPSLTGHQQVHKSETMERVEGIAEVIFNYYQISDKDIMIVISNSGRNAAPIEMAQICQENSVPVIAVTSMVYTKSVSSRHSSGAKLYQHADIVVDNGCPLGDCLMELEGVAQPVGPGSGVIGLYILHALTVQAIQFLRNDGIDPPVFRSGNLDGSDSVNKALMEKYRGRIKLW